MSINTIRSRTHVIDDYEDVIPYRRLCRFWRYRIDIYASVAAATSGSPSSRAGSSMYLRNRENARAK